MPSPRNTRARRLIGKLNKIRHQQAKKIDILCNDMVSIHSDFVAQLREMEFGVQVYHDLIGQSDYFELMCQVVKSLQKSIGSLNIAIRLWESDRFETHGLCESCRDLVDASAVEGWFTPEVCQKIRKSHAVQDLQTITEPSEPTAELWNKVAGAAIPLGKNAKSIGFLLAYRYDAGPLSNQEVKRLSSVTPGLSQAIRSAMEEMNQDIEAGA